jgi:hypothetical protein
MCEYRPMGELMARAVTNNVYRFVVPAVASPARLVPLASLANENEGLIVTALRAAIDRGRLRSQKADDGWWRSSRRRPERYRASRYKCS